MFHIVLVIYLVLHKDCIFLYNTSWSLLVVYIDPPSEICHLCHVRYDIYVYVYA